MLPKDFIERIKNQIDDADDFLKSYDQPYIKALRFNRSKNPNEIFEGCADYSAKEVDKARVKWEDRGVYYYEDNDISVPDFLKINEPGKSALHAAGAYYIQEASAMISVTKLDLNKNALKVLDLCGAPGGKTTQIADYMQGKGLLVANEIVPSRAKILSENIERMGVSNALVVSEDPKRLQNFFPHFFDRILVDAPCSGEGMFRKHNEAINEWSPENVTMCARRQDEILDCAVNMLAAGGRIVYSTCTFSNEEDEECIDRFLIRHPEFVRGEADERIFPHRDAGEGHFAAVLVYKTSYYNYEESDCDDGKDVVAELFINKKKNKKDKKSDDKISKSALEIISDFCRASIKNGFVADYFNGELKSSSEKGNKKLISFGERLFLAPSSMPDLRGISVLRPGLALGKIIKDRFEPDHALALAINKEDAVHCVDFPADSVEIKGYLRGNTINYDGPKGWYLICTEGISLGWGKCVNGCIKNHYPKGLRIQD